MTDPQGPKKPRDRRGVPSSSGRTGRGAASRRNLGDPGATPTNRRVMGATEGNAASPGAVRALRALATGQNLGRARARVGERAVNGRARADRLRQPAPVPRRDTNGGRREDVGGADPVAAPDAGERAPTATQATATTTDRAVARPTGIGRRPSPAAGGDLFPTAVRTIDVKPEPVNVAALRRARSIELDRRPILGDLEPDPVPTRLGAVLLVVAAALLVQSIGYAVGRSGNQTSALTLFFVGLLGIFIPCAWRLLSPTAARTERLQVAVVLGLALAASLIVAFPFGPVSFDELIHRTTLWQVQQQRTVFGSNSVLPVSPYYPGLEMTTVAVKWLTGLPTVLAEDAVIAMARLVLVLAVFLFAERVTRSHRAAGIAVLVYAVSPQFYGFNASYAYQTLALSLAAGAVYLLLREVDVLEPRVSWRLLLPIACLAGMTVTHHLTGWITVTFLVVWCGFLAISHQRQALRVVGTATAAGLAFVIGWTAFNEARLVAYIKPLLLAAVDGLTAVITGSSKQRQLFRLNSAYATPAWQEVVLVLSALALLVLMLAALWSVLRRRSMRGGLLRWMPSIVALGYLGVLGSRLSDASSDVGIRASTFVFFGLALIVAQWFVTVRRPPRRSMALGVASLCFLGSMILGTGPQWSYVPGKYLPAGDQRAVDKYAMAASQWAATNLPADSRIAADRDNGVLMAAVGHLTPVDALDGSVNVGPLYFDQVWGRYDNTLVRQGQIRFLVVDDRMADGPPAYGFYIAPGETQGKEQLTKAELAKLSHIPGAVRIYDSGPIQIYDLSSILGIGPVIAGTGAGGTGGQGPDWWVFGSAVAVAGVWLLRRRPSFDGDSMIKGLLTAAVAGMTFAFVVVPSKVPATPVALGVLGLLLVGGLRPGLQPRRPRRRKAPGAPHRGIQIALGLVSVVLFGGAVGVAVVSAKAFWRAPTSLSVLYDQQGTRTVSVHLASGVTGGTVRELVRGRVVWSHTHVGTGTWATAMPAGTRPGAQVQLVVHRQVVLEAST
jgi:hypothetical protein